MKLRYVLKVKKRFCEKIKRDQGFQGIKSSIKHDTGVWKHVLCLGDNQVVWYKLHIKCLVIGCYG